MKWLFNQIFKFFVFFGTIYLLYWFWTNTVKVIPQTEVIEAKIKEASPLKDKKANQLSIIPLKIKDKTLLVEVVKSSKERAKGLMYRSFLKKDTGMFFIFEKVAIYDFWMANVNFPLDIVWIDEHFNIVDIKTVQACKEKNIKNCPKYKPKEEAKYVLEVNAKNFPGEIGDSINISLEFQ
jgi:uncharacterized membrane protein (UPF0127 family)